LLGQWYVIEQFDTSSTCLTLNYTRVSPTQLKVTKSRQLVLLDSLRIEHTNSYTGTLDIPDGDKSGKMRVKWPLNIAGKADYIVFDTDGSSYAAVFECQQLTRIGHRASATILSKTPTLDAAIIAEIKKKMTDQGLDTHDFDVIDHSVCIRREDSDLNINIDEDTFKKIIGDASDSFKTIASQVMTFLQVANGASNFADTVVDVTRRLGASTNGSSDTSAAVLVDPDVELLA
ncbi:Apolipoprotein D-like 9, partial [Homarus americanus]